MGFFSHLLEGTDAQGIRAKRAWFSEIVYHAGRRRKTKDGSGKLAEEPCGKI